MIYGYMLSPINEANVNDIILKEDQTKIKYLVNSYKNEINNYCVESTDEDMCYLDRYTNKYITKFKFKGISTVSINYNTTLKSIVLYYTKDDFDYPKATQIISKMIVDKLNKEDIADKYKFYVKNLKISGRTIGYIIIENKNNNEKISSNNKSDTSKLSNENKELLIAYKELSKRLVKAGYKSSKKTYRIEVDDEYDEVIFTYAIYDDNYIDSNSDYDNGLSKKDKQSNEKFVNTLLDIAKQVAKEYKYKFEYKEYRGNGQIIFSK